MRRTAVKGMAVMHGPARGPYGARARGAVYNHRGCARGRSVFHACSRGVALVGLADRAALPLSLRMDSPLKSR